MISRISPTPSLDAFLWRQVVAGMRGVRSSTALRMHARCMWRHREGVRNVSNTAICRALSPLRPCRSVPADVHGCPPRCGTAQAPSRERANPVVHTGGETPQALFMPREARPVRLSSFRLLVMASPPLDARRTLLIAQHTSRSVRGADRRYKVSDSNVDAVWSAGGAPS